MAVFDPDGTGGDFAYCGGAATGHFEVADLVPALTLEAYGAGDDTPVMPLRWRLER
jgi:hypothetical protein